MKYLFILAVATLFPLSSYSAWANEPQPASTPDFNATQTAGTIAPVGVGQNSELVTPEARSQQLNERAQQINQSTGTSGGSSGQAAIRDLLNLPDGMIIRGSSRGGVGVGTEFE
jgi:hypothetical protein